MLIGFRKLVQGKLLDKCWINTVHFREITWTMGGNGSLKLVDSDGRATSLEPEEAAQLGGRLLTLYPMPASDFRRGKGFKQDAPELIAFRRDNGDPCWINLAHWKQVLWRHNSACQLFPSYPGPKNILSQTEAEQFGYQLERWCPPVGTDGRVKQGSNSGELHVNADPAATLSGQNRSLL